MICLNEFFFIFVVVPVKGGALGRYIQRKLSGLNIFEEPFLLVRENLRTGVSICEQWVVACEHLTGQVWQKLICTKILFKYASLTQKYCWSLYQKKYNECQNYVCLYVLSQVWKRHAPHPWKGNKHCPQTLHCLAKRLNEVTNGSNMILIQEHERIISQMF